LNTAKGEHVYVLKMLATEKLNMCKCKIYNDFEYFVSFMLL